MRSLLSVALLLVAFIGLAGFQYGSKVTDCAPDQRCVSFAGPEELTPAQRAEQERRDREAKARAAAFKAKVDARVLQLGGEHRRAEAENYVKMQEAAEAARPKPPPESKPPKPCKEQTLPTFAKGAAPTSAQAIAQLEPAAARDCSARTGSPAHQLGPPKCERIGDGIARPPVGKCLACVSRQQAEMMGWRPDVGWGKPTYTWQCSAGGNCAKPVKNCPASVSAQ